MWGLANIGLRKARPPDAFAFMVWVSLVPPIPLLALSMVFEGPRADLHALAHISAGGLGALFYVAYISTLVGFGTWGWLLAVTRPVRSACTPCSFPVRHLLGGAPAG